MTVASVMTKNPITVRDTDGVTDAQALMRREKVHLLPVLDHGKKLVGIVSEKDLLYASPSPASTLDVYEMANLLSKLKVEKVMTREVHSVTKDTLIEDAARIMVDNQITGVPVMDGDVLVGLVTENDLFRLLIELFGSREAGVRVTLRVPERPGELADMAQAVTAEGGNIISLGTFPGNDVTNAVCILKANDISKEKLLAVLKPLIIEVMDVREA